MRLLLDKNTTYDEQILYLKELNGEYNDFVIFHCYWNGNLNEKHLISIKSCYFFNVLNRKNKKIILWIENNVSNEYNIKIKEFCEIKTFNLENEIKDTFLENKEITYIGGSSGGLSEKANFYRLVLLYNYGGCWFDLDIFFLQCFEPIFNKFKNTNLVYQWENQNYPNNAIYISLEPKNITMKNNIEYIHNLNNGWGFQRAKLTYDISINLLVLPCAMFDSGWMDTSFSKKERWKQIFFEEFIDDISLSSFYSGSFAYHWHNNWNSKIHPNSIIRKLENEINSKLSQKKKGGNKYFLKNLYKIEDNHL